MSEPEPPAAPSLGPGGLVNLNNPAVQAMINAEVSRRSVAQLKQYREALDLTKAQNEQFKTQINNGTQMVTEQAAWIRQLEHETLQYRYLQ